VSKKSLELWWHEEGRAAYPNATTLLVLCDGGGSNSATAFVFKEDLQGLTDRLGIEIRVAHFPPYCSKFNLLALQRHLTGLRRPIEHRLFPHVTRALQGVVLESVEVAKQFMEKTSTSTGLKVTVRCLEKVYATGRKCAEGFKDSIRIVFDAVLPKWNYVAVPDSG
jgi:Rhodopirellula transposase DDE domain